MALGCEVYDVFMYFLLSITLHRSLIVVDVGSCLLHVVMIPCFMLCGIFLYDVRAVITLYVMIWDPLLYVAGILLFSSYMFCSGNPFDAMLTGCSSCMFLYHTDRSLLIKDSSFAITLRATPMWGNFSLYDHNINCRVHQLYLKCLMQRPTPSWHQGLEM